MDALLAQPVDFFLSLAKSAGPAFAPISEAWNGYSKEFLNEVAPGVVDNIDAFLKGNVSPNAKALPLMNPFDVALIMLGYLTMIFVSSTVMHFLPALKLKNFAMLHNLFLMGLSAYMVVEIIHQGRPSLSFSFFLLSSRDLICSALVFET